MRPTYALVCLGYNSRLFVPICTICVPIHLNEIYDAIA
jgi:hypothetical protein